MPALSTPSHGQHGGPLLPHATGYVEISVFETEVPPRFRLYFLDEAMQPVAPPAADSVAMETERPGNIQQRFGFRREDEFLESCTNIPEPHEFLARVDLDGRRQRLATLFTEEGHDHDHAHGDAEHGDHGGPVVAHADGLLEISVFETGVPPRFRLYFQDNQGQATRTLSAETITLTTVRPDRTEQIFLFRQEGEFLESTTDIPEPHEFDARLDIQREDGRQWLVTPFTEEGHAHGEAAHQADAHGHGSHEHGGHGHGGHGHGDHGHGDHGHDHGGSGLLGWLKGTFAHSHDVSDKVDSVMESSEKGIRVLKISLIGLGITALLQVLVVLYSGSVALLADTIHNFADAATSIPLWIAFALARRGANRRFTYGYGKTEDVAGVIIVGVIFFSACVAGYEAILKLIHPEPMTHLGLVSLAAIIGFIGNEAVAVYRIRVGREIGSAALIADGQHSRVDGFTSLSVLIGVLGTWLGYPLVDPIVGIGITIAILFIVKDAAKAVWHRLIDGIEPEILDEIAHAPSHVAGVRAVRTVRARWIGHKVYSDVAIAVDPNLPVHVADAIARAVERSLREHVRLLGEVVVRVTL
ncbi:MAG: cation transporter [Magnetococcales bacterium]|nr:cation transporter [Magnetococcales bacterium]